jgi:hypothetical protein
MWAEALSSLEAIPSGFNLGGMKRGGLLADQQGGDTIPA